MRYVNNKRCSFRRHTQHLWLWIPIRPIRLIPNRRPRFGSWFALITVTRNRVYPFAVPHFQRWTHDNDDDTGVASHRVASRRSRNAARNPARRKIVRRPPSKLRRSTAMLGGSPPFFIVHLARHADPSSSFSSSSSLLFLGSLVFPRTRLPSARMDTRRSHLTFREFHRVLACKIALACPSRRKRSD